jgi:hypothetical protein
MRKAQIQQAFVYIIAVVVIGFIVMMGFKYITMFTGKKCDVELYDFETKINQYITKHAALGEYFEESIKAPCQYKSVCFVDARAIKDTANPKKFSDNTYPVIKQGVDRGVQQNIFLISDKVEPVGYNAGLALADKEFLFCVKRTSGSFRLAFRGQGLIGEQLMTSIEKGE